ncbi:uncharacterized protein BX664DRAFT_318823 [Halteromyces radiatus]|uniref:uncharacterized protein n=1 Tax=Halteromyces radiatus TaxID=101107 RepID=UPI00221F2498|nr:uncharacterized protein BX664DRAFT_318823 [Halteromyces radiatus]KAI8098488.1 hypothetical protein BX664DRAFT_318823 [Halteromyces radiatus]
MLNKFTKGLALFSSFALVASQNTSQCLQYPSSGICAQYIDYPVYTKIGINATEQQALATLPVLKQQMGAIDPGCVDTYYRYACSAAYPKCTATANQTTILAGCLSTCNEIQRSCGLIFELTNQTSLLPNCNQQPGIPLQSDDSCNLIKPQVDNQHSGLNLSAIPADFKLSTCPAPFLIDPIAQQDPTKSSNPISCRFGCCIPCPYQNYLYNEGWIEHAFFATDIVRSVSAVGAFFIMVSYFVLPDKRRHPSLLILNFSVAVFLFSFVAFFSVGNPKKLQCADAITASTQGNNSLCAAQGAILMFSSLATVLWCCALIVNLHLHTVWSSNFFTNRYFLLHLICWGIPAAFMAAALGLKQIQYEFANLCLVSLDEIFNLFFYPMAAIVIPSFVLHMGTFLYIARIAVREGIDSDLSQSASNGSIGRAHRAVRHKHVIQAVHIQWRALLLAVIACTTVLFYWIFYFTQLRHASDFSSDSSIIDSWLQCMITPGNTQDSCVSIVSSHLPPFGLMVAAEALVSVIGIWIFLIFAKRSIFIEWNDLIYNVRVYLGGRGRAEKHGEQFFQL